MPWFWYVQWKLCLRKNSLIWFFSKGIFIYDIIFSLNCINCKGRFGTDGMNAVTTYLMVVVLIANTDEGISIETCGFWDCRRECMLWEELSEKWRTFSKCGEKIFLAYNNTDGLKICMFSNLVSPLGGYFRYL